MIGLTQIKQKGFIDNEKVSKWKLKIFGVGAIGATLTVQAARVGFKDISVYDFDKVEEENIGSQEFKVPHIGMKKTEAIQKMMSDDYNMDITAIDGKVTKKTEIFPEDNTIYFCGFDSLEARKMLWDKIKGFPIVWGESRIGRDEQRYYFVDLREKNDKWVTEYEKTMASDAPRTELKCGEKGTYPSNAELVGKLVRQLVNIAEGKPITTLYAGKWGRDNAIYREPKEELAGEIKYD